MRICGGRFKGRKMSSFSGLAVRPTPEHVREALFNIIGQDLTGERVLDLFAGTGILGLESISRGAQKALFVDTLPQALSLIRKNIDILRIQDQTIILRHNLNRGLNPIFRIMPEFDLVFLDPPYNKNLAQPVLEQLDGDLGLSDGGLVIVEHFRTELADVVFRSLVLERRKPYGQTTISIFKKVKDTL